MELEAGDIRYEILLHAITDSRQLVVCDICKYNKASDNSQCLKCQSTERKNIGFDFDLVKYTKEFRASRI